MSHFIYKCSESTCIRRRDLFPPAIRRISNRSLWPFDFQIHLVLRILLCCPAPRICINFYWWCRPFISNLSRSKCVSYKFSWNWVCSGTAFLRMPKINLWALLYWGNVGERIGLTLEGRMFYLKLHAVHVLPLWLKRVADLWRDSIGTQIVLIA